LELGSPWIKKDSPPGAPSSLHILLFVALSLELELGGPFTRGPLDFVYPAHPIATLLMMLIAQDAESGLCISELRDQVVTLMLAGHEVLHAVVVVAAAAATVAATVAATTVVVVVC